MRLWTLLAIYLLCSCSLGRQLSDAASGVPSTGPDPNRPSPSSDGAPGLGVLSFFATDYQGMRPPLAQTPFIPLPIGTVQADGWLKTQLTQQIAGITSQAETQYVDLGPGSPWKGGNLKSGNWPEVAPYYVKGLVATAYVSGDANLIAKAQAWLDWTLDHLGSDGFLGPADLATAGDGQNWWGRSSMLYALKDYYEATGDSRVVPALVGWFEYVSLNMSSSNPPLSWAAVRIGDALDIVNWLYNQTGESFLLALSDTITRLSYIDIVKLYSEGLFFDTTGSAGFPAGDIMPKHNVNVEQAIRMPALRSVRSNSDVDRNAYAMGHSHLMRQHAQVHGVPAGNEMLSDDSSTVGVELCAVVERMQSDEEAQMILGDPSIGDHLEQVAFNALPGAIKKDFTAHQYFSLPNQVQSLVAQQGYEQDNSTSLTPSVASNFPCCRYNMHMGWPYYIKNMWAATSDNGLAAMAYGPSHLTAKVAGGATVTLTETTNYPFADAITISVSLTVPTAFPLKVRIPTWSTAPLVSVNGQTQPNVVPGSYYTLQRTWSDGDTVTINLPANFKASSQINHSVAIERGPLVFSLQMQEHWSGPMPLNNGELLGAGVNPLPGYGTWEVTPDNNWRYALVVDANNLANSLQLHTRPMVENPFIQATTPLYVTATARQVDYWGMLPTNSALAAEPPFPAVTSNPYVTVTLVPYGAENIRLSYFPVAVDAGARVEAEGGTLSGGAQVGTANAGYVGTGYIDFRSTAGAAVSLPVSTSGASGYYLTLHYSAGAGNSNTTTLSVNGVTLSPVTLPTTGNWLTWVDSAPIRLPVSLPAGTSAVAITNGSGNPVNVDYVALTSLGSSVHEAENAIIGGAGTVAANQPRYSGSGFVDFLSNSGSTVTVSGISVPADGVYEVVLRYSAGGAIPQNAFVTANGGMRIEPALVSTGAWNYWQDADPVQLHLTAGTNNTIVVTNGAPPFNLDYLTVSQTPLPCHAGPPALSLDTNALVADAVGHGVFSVTAVNNDGLACPPASLHFNIQMLNVNGAASMLPKVASSFSINDVVVAPGNQLTTAATVVIPYQGPNTFVASITATNTNTGEMGTIQGRMILP